MPETKVHVRENRDLAGERREPFWLVEVQKDETAPWVETPESCNNFAFATGRAAVLAKRLAAMGG